MHESLSDLAVTCWRPSNSRPSSKDSAWRHCYTDVRSIAGVVTPSRIADIAWTAPRGRHARRPQTRARARRAITSLAAFLLSMLMLLAACIEAPASRLAHPRANAVVLVGAPAVPDVDVPQKARDVLAEIERRHGEPPPGYVGGRAFQNRERHLPRGSYREYDVSPKASGRARGAERIVIERKTGRAYYTRDHYETFVPMN